MLGIERVLAWREVAVDFGAEAGVDGGVGEDEVEEVGERDGGRVRARDHSERPVRYGLAEWRCGRFRAIFVVLCEGRCGYENAVEERGTYKVVKEVTGERTVLDALDGETDALADHALDEAGEGGNAAEVEHDPWDLTDHME